MPEVDAARRFLRRLVDELRRRDRASPEGLAAAALLASRLGHRSLAASLTRLALRGRPTPDQRIAWLLHRLVADCLAESPEHAGDLARTGKEAAATLTTAYHITVEAGDLDLINGAGGIGMALWDVLDAAERVPFASALTRTARALLDQPGSGLYHGRAGGVLLSRMLGREYGQDPTVTTAVDALVREFEGLATAALDPDVLRAGWVALCAGQPGILAALGPTADPAVLARFAAVPIASKSLDWLDQLLADATADVTVCHGLAGLSLATRLAPAWREVVGPDRAARLAARLAAHLDQVDDLAMAGVVDGPFVMSVVEGALGVALALAETVTTTLPWWGIAVSLGDGTPVVAGTGGPR